MTFLTGLELPQWFFRIFVLAIILTSFSLGVNAILHREIEIQEAKIPIVLEYMLNCIKDNKEISLDTDIINWKIEIFHVTTNKKEELFGNEPKFKADYPLCYLKYQNKRINCVEREFYLLKENKPINLKITLIYEK